MLKVRLLQTEQVFKLDEISFQHEEGDSYFILKSTENADISIVVTYPLNLYQSYLPINFNCVPFITPSYFKENNIFEVHVDDQKIGRLGWIFPIQALLSKEHSYADNEHFLKYAFVAFYKLLLGEYFKNDIIIDLSNFETQLDLNDCYNYGLIVLCLSNEKTEMLSNFDIKNYLHSLYAYKYFYCRNPEEIKSLKLVEENPAVITKLIVREISQYLKNEIFIKSLFEVHLKSSNHPLVQFHLLYQIIELLINRVYDCEVRLIIKYAEQGSKNSHDLLKKINQVATEEYRIKELLNKYLSKSLSFPNELIRSGNLLLSHFNITKDNLAEVFYGVRNKVVHDYRIITDFDTHYTFLKDINNDFEKVLIHILSYYFEITEGSNDMRPLSWLMYQALLEK